MNFNDILSNLNEGVIEVNLTNSAPQIATVELNGKTYGVKFNNEFVDLDKFPTHKNFAIELINKGLINKKFDTLTKKELAK